MNCVAKALYDNIAESPDELAFRKGDLLTVLEQNTGGIEGWWLCSLRGRQGICPGNRLRLLPGFYDIGTHDLPVHNLSKRRSWHVQPNIVLTPQKFGDIYLYNLPPGSQSQRYDIPTPHQDLMTPTQAYDIPRAISREGSESVLSNSKTPLQVAPQPDFDRGGENMSYDIPRPLATTAYPLTPSSSASSLTAPESVSLPSSNRSSLLSGPDYDVPKSRLSTSQLYDVPAPNPKPKELPLELTSALESLNRLQHEASGAVQRLLGLFSPSWRSPENLRNGILDIKLAAERLRTSLHELSEFYAGSLGNAYKAADKNLIGKLKPLAKALRDSDKIVQDACNDLDSRKWSLEDLSRTTDQDFTLDSLDRLIACAKSLTEDIRRAASSLQGNASLLFKRDSTLVIPDDYDYVNLHSKDPTGNNDRDVNPTDFNKSSDGEDNGGGQTESDDSRLIRFYAALTVTHTAQLTKAIDSFLQTVEHNQPPKIFLAHGKFVVLSAHRLVYFGDAVARNVTQTHIKQRVQERADGLSEALDQTVQRTKRAAQHFPNVAAVQDMVDAIVDVSHFARDLKMTLVLAM
ncbi:hypothetical protein RUM44_003088 [Polyplax serrata]|uniref:SH3 domain-containing protein n=1 Tax=Polyplax serrata TaxID=468196 RepID=A0ABR1AXJ8_POLSC